MNGQTQTELSVSAVLRLAFRTYVGQAPVLLATAMVLVVVVRLDTALLRGAAGIVVSLINLLLLALFVCFVVCTANEVWEHGARPHARELLRRAWEVSGRLLLVGLLAGVALSLASAVGSVLLVLIIVGAVSAAGPDVTTILLVGGLLVTIVLLVPTLYLMTAWSVFVPVAVLERPRGLRALGRSRRLVRGNGSRVLALVMIVTLPLAVGPTALAGVPHLIGGGPALVGGMLLATLIAPIPVLATTALYHALREMEPTAEVL